VGKRRRSLLHQLDGNVVGRGDVAEERAVDALLQGHGKRNALDPQLLTEGRKITLVMKPK
jgi:hypothetical protein